MQSSLKAIFTLYPLLLLSSIGKCLVTFGMGALHRVHHQKMTKTHMQSDLSFTLDFNWGRCLWLSIYPNYNPCHSTHIRLCALRYFMSNSQSTLQKNVNFFLAKPQHRIWIQKTLSSRRRALTTIHVVRWCRVLHKVLRPTFVLNRYNWEFDTESIRPPEFAQGLDWHAQRVVLYRALTYRLFLACELSY